MQTYVTICMLFDSMGVIMISILVWYELEKKSKNKLSSNPNNVQNQVKRNFQKVADPLSARRWKAIYPSKANEV